jgi:hypothetical protein
MPDDAGLDDAGRFRPCGFGSWTAQIGRLSVCQPPKLGPWARIRVGRICKASSAGAVGLRERLLQVTQRQLPPDVRRETLPALRTKGVRAWAV